MSPTTAGPETLPRGGSPTARLAVALAALLVVGGLVALLGWLAGLSTPVPPPAPKNPFGTGLREAVPAATGLGGFILAVQSQFYRALTSAVAALKQDGAIWPLVGIGVAYGVFHAAGPGHGKGLISAYLVASERSLKRGLWMSLAAALLQAAVAIAIVALFALALGATARSINATAHTIELVSFGAVALVGAVLLWRKAGKFLTVRAMARGVTPARAGACDDHCDHVHLPPPDTIDRMRSWREVAGVVVAAGIRPCSGAIIVLVFALSQGLFAAGVAATLAMALGTALTTGALATLAVFAKAFALKLAGGRGLAGTVAVTGLEVLASAFVLVLGLALLAGLRASGLPS
ncbi:nickel transporter [Chelatococcus sp. SYSU_G07232]|uniref:Nickel/cobalt efflux system n=1 Tax=Chelatococcus albus TaxID=3047466 RepID=A0ABT7AIB8_9HYPH|nr:nickel transporter [Chelatococcus sp. SYSU_G07232]MDJ1158336.1 nickel transporter [Chelatococcus sp. SYSU_G07232]